MNRSSLREHAFRILYELEFLEDPDVEGVIGTYLENFSEEKAGKKERAFISREVTGVYERRHSLDEMLEPYVKRWSVDRLGKVDVSILRLALFEIRFMPDIPVSVSVKEAVDLAGRYAQEEAAGFINGILGSIAASEEEPHA